MSLVSLVILIVVLGLIWWLIVTYVPIPQPGKIIVNVIFVVLLILILLNLVGISDIKIR